MFTFSALDSRALSLVFFFSFSAVTFGSTFDVSIATPSLQGTSAELLLDFIDGGTPSNTVAISNFATDGVLGTSQLTGGATGSLTPGPATITDSSFFNEFLQNMVLGSSLSFQVDASTNPPDAGSVPDEFSVYLYDSTGTNSLVNTSDSTGANALFEISSDGSWQAYTSTDAVTALVPATASAPEPDSLLLLGMGMGLLALWRYRPCRRMAVATLACSAAMFGQSYNFSKIVYSGQPMPDGSGPFEISFVSPVIEGSKIVFPSTVETYSCFVAVGSFWTYDMVAANFTKLVDTNTPVPGGTGNFVCFGGINPRQDNAFLQNGTVMFAGGDSAGSGYYTVPAGGGTISLVANYNTTSPDGSAFNSFDGEYSVYNGTTDFDASTANRTAGIWTASITGESIAEEENGSAPCHPNSFFPDGNFTSPWRNGSHVVFTTGNVFGFTGVYVDSCANELIASNTPLPGDPGSGAATVVNGDTVRLEGNTVAFLASDENDGYSGVFTVALDTLAVTKIASTADTLPGLGTPVAGFGGITLKDGSILFRATGTAGGTGNSGLYLWSGGTITKIAATGDTVNGFHVSNVFNPSGIAMSNGNIVFGARFTDDNDSIYLATPVQACATDVTSQLAITRSGFGYNRATKHYVQTVQITNNGAALTGPINLVLENLASASLTGASGTTTCETPAGSPYVTVTSGGLGSGASASVVLQFSDPSNGAISYTPVVTSGGTP